MELYKNIWNYIKKLWYNIKRRLKCRIELEKLP